MQTRTNNETIDKFLAMITPEARDKLKEDLTSALARAISKLISEDGYDKKSHEQQDQLLAARLYKMLPEDDDKKALWKIRSKFYGLPGTRTGKDWYGNITRLWGWGNRTTNWHGRVMRAFASKIKKEAEEIEIQSNQTAVEVLSEGAVNINPTTVSMMPQSKTSQNPVEKHPLKQNLHESELEEQVQKSAEEKKEMSKIEEFMEDANTVPEITTKLTEIINNQANILKPSNNKDANARAFIAKISGYKQKSIVTIINEWHKSIIPKLIDMHGLDALVAEAEEKAIEDIPKILQSFINPKNTTETDYPYDIFLSKLSAELIASTIYDDIGTTEDRKKHRTILRDAFRTLSVCSVLKSGDDYSLMKTYAGKISKDIVPTPDNLSLASTVSVSTAQCTPRSILKNCTEIGKILEKKVKGLSAQEKNELQTKVFNATEATSAEDGKSKLGKLTVCPLTPIRAFHGDEEQVDSPSFKVEYSGASAKLRTVGIFPAISEKENTENHELDAAATKTGILVEA